jgi:DNA-binding transcriptional LysR family regulator
VDIELRLLRSFVQIHEAGSISRAAERMACTQAAMSMRLKMLETELGAALFERKPQGLEPTPRGAEFYAKTLAVLGAYDEMMSATRSRPARDRICLLYKSDAADDVAGV